MNTLVHLAGLMSALLLAYLFLVVFPGRSTGDETQLAAAGNAGASALCLSGINGWPESGRLRLDGDYYNYSPFSGHTPCSGTAVDISPELSAGQAVDQGVYRVEAGLEWARYIGAAMLVVALVMLVALIVAMRYDWLEPLGDEV